MKKNIIWFMSDQHRAQALSINGDRNLSTPNLDNAAKSGVHFTSAVSGFPLCCPFRGSMLTGKYPHKCVPGHEKQLDPKQKTIAHVFREAGYTSAYLGKWHLDGFKEELGRGAKHIVPRERRGGFDYWLGYENNNSPFDSWVHGHKQEEEISLYRLPCFETDALTDIALSFIKEQKNNKEKPFFLIISVQPPHNPYVAPAEFLAKHKPDSLHLRPNVPASEAYQTMAKEDIAGYCGMVENIDWNFGRVQQCLRDEGLDLDTHLLYFSDHGDMLHSHGQRNKTRPFEESVRIPFIISGEQPFSYDNRKSGKTNALLNHVDIAPTSLGLCGIQVPDWMEGYDYSYYRQGEKAEGQQEPESAFLQNVLPTGNHHSLNRPWRGVVTKDNWKYACFESMPWLLFNLNDDPYEQANLAHNNLYYPKQRELLAILAEWIKKTDDTFVLPEV